MDIQAKLLTCPDSFEEMEQLVDEWLACNVSTIYLLAQQIRRPHVQLAIESFTGERWIVVQTLLDTENGEFPLAITDSASEANGTGNGSWLRMLCPRGINSQGRSIEEHRIGQILTLIREHSPTGISLDFIRHFLFWEEIYIDAKVDNFPRSCFCEQCQLAFSRQYNLTIPQIPRHEQISWILKLHENSWNQFAETTISDLIIRIAKAIKAEAKECKINVHVVPWTKNEYSGARITHVGQDLAKLSEYVDQFSPMCYTPMLKRPFNWISTLVESLAEEAQKPIIPALQICSMYGTEPLSSDQFTLMIESVQAKKTGVVVIWPWERITKEQIEIVRNQSGLND